MRKRSLHAHSIAGKAVTANTDGSQSVALNVKVSWRAEAPVSGRAFEIFSAEIFVPADVTIAASGPIPDCYLSKADANGFTTEVTDISVGGSIISLAVSSMNVEATGGLERVSISCDPNTVSDISCSLGGTITVGTDEVTNVTGFTITDISLGVAEAGESMQVSYTVPESPNALPNTTVTTVAATSSAVVFSGAEMYGYFTCTGGELSVNEAPLAVGDSYQVEAGSSLVVADPGVLENDTDDGNRSDLQVVVVSDVTGGTRVPAVMTDGRV